MMTVTIAPIQAKPPSQGSSADSAGTAETPVAGADFASLLLGQLATEASLQEGITADLPTPAAQGLPDATVTPQDAAMLLAALGMAPTPSTPPALNGRLPTETDILPAGKDEKTSAALPIGVTANPDSGQLEASLANDPLAKTALPVALETGDKAAKFAVEGFAATKPDALAIKSLPNDSSAAPPPVSASLTANQPGNTALTTSAPLRVDTPVRDPAWSADFSQKVVWLTANDQKSAQLTLNPPQMGPIEISLNINKDTASAYFISPNAEVREAIETALPRLREMLAGVGIELGQTNVGAQSSQQEPGNPEARAGTPRWITDTAILGKDSGHSQVSIVQRGSSLVDTFA
jgi:flagellar hook-length control protein FliK